MVNKILEFVKVCNKNEKWDIQADIPVGKKKNCFETKAFKFSHDYVIEKDASLVRKSHKMQQLYATDSWIIELSDDYLKVPRQSFAIFSLIY